MSQQPAIAFHCRGALPEAAETQLANALELPLVMAEATQLGDYEFYLRLEKAGLTLYRNEKKAPGGLRIDFGDGALQRRASDKPRQQNLGKAVGLRANTQLRILDAMAGLGKDAWLMASAGAEVEMLERSAIVHALLGDALARGQQQGLALATILDRMALRQGDFVELAPTLPQFDVVYLDPMFPPRQKNARAKRNMFLLQSLLGETSNDEFELLRQARLLASRRVVVKRGRLSAHLGGQRPDIEFKGRSNRYDVYLTGLTS